MRKKIIAGNWKMNYGPQETEDFIKTIKDKVNTDTVDVVFCVPFVDIPKAAKLLANTNIKIGAQNMHYVEAGAFTGEISAPMLVELGVKYVIIGHSERRMHFKETDEVVNQKLRKALACALIPIVCVGESKDERKDNVTFTVVREQIQAAFAQVSEAAATKVVVAYEPIWAIGAQQAATPAQAEEVCAFIRQVLAEMYDTKTAENIRIQYGGSVTADNAKALFTMPNIDGGLVGGASIKPEFERIVHFE